MAQKVTESVKGMDQGMETVAESGLDRAGLEVDKGLEGSAFKSPVSGGKSGSAEADETVGGSALVGEVGSDDAEDADSLDFDDMDSGELTDMENTGVLVYREKFISKERRQKYWGYFVVGMLRGRKVRVSLVSTDAGGYDLLDIVFNGADSVELWRKPYSMKDEKGKITASGFTYDSQSFFCVQLKRYSVYCLDPCFVFLHK